MVSRHTVKGYEQFKETIKSLEGVAMTIYVLFTSSSNSDGTSWCPDCTKAEPIIEEGLKTAPKGTHFIKVEVGDRPTWKDPNSPFRTDKELRIKSVPTLTIWGKPDRLEDVDCAKLELVKMIFEETD